MEMSLRIEEAFARAERAGDRVQETATVRPRREELFARLADNPHLPSPPGVVLQILERTSHLDCTAAELAAVLHRDAALCGKVLKTVNSALYGLPRPVASIERAVALFGLKSVRSLVLSLSLPALQRQASVAPPPAAFWKQSVSGAILAHALAMRLRLPSPEDDMVAGLLRDIGVLALQSICPVEYALLLAHPEEELARDQCQLERQRFGLDHAEVSAVLLGRWRLPADIIESVRFHHAPEKAEDLPHGLATRVRLLAFASRIAQLPGNVDPAELHDLIAFGNAHFGLDEAALTAFLEPLAGKIEEFAAVMELDLGPCDRYPSILARASEELVNLTLETSTDKLRLLEQKQHAEQETERWRSQTRRLRDELVRDPLTNAFNRGCLEEQLRSTFRRACRRGVALGLIFLDLDDFKGINDRFGHLFGDRVLKETARSLFEAVRHGDLVARYGGDEFCVLVENTSPEGLRAMTDRLRQDLNRRVLECENRTETIRASVGAVLCLPRTLSHTATELFALADRAMYAAKTTGKNQIAFVSLLSEEDSRFLQAVQRRRFGTWLEEAGIGKSPSLNLAVRRAGSRFEALGRLAHRLGWLTADQRRRILREQRASGRRFDEIARERNLLSFDRICGLLALQLEPPERLAENLVNQGVLGEPAMREHLDAYYRWLRKS